MASLRLCFLSSFLKKTRFEANNLGVIIRRTNHVLAQSRLITLLNQDSANQLTDFHRYRLVYRLEHRISSANNFTTVSEDSSQSSESPVKSYNAEKTVSEVASATGNVDGSKGVTETVSFLDESSLPPMPDGSVVVMGETSLKSLGLAGWSPPGIVQQILEFIHVSFNVPWWAAIIGLTFIVRFFMIPLSIRMRKDVIHYSNNMPQYQYLQNKVTEARNSGSYFEVAQYSQELCQFLQEKKLFSLGMTVPYFVQMPVFISVFLALKGMAETPELKSFETGGVLWFTDLSIPDQFYILPLMTAGTIWLTFKFGSTAETMKTTPALVKRAIEIGAPVVIFLIVTHFPAATVCYWTTTNIFVLLQNFILSLEPVRKYLNIPKQIINIPKPPNKAKKGMVEGFKESYKNLRIAKEIEDRERLNAVKFEQNSSAPLRRTFKFNPKEIPSLVQNKEKK